MMTIIQIVYLIGAAPALIMPFYYHFTNKWWTSTEGRLFMLMMLLPFGLYAATMLFLLVEQNWFRDTLRLGLVSLVSLGTWSTLVVYRKIRKNGLGDRQRRRTKRLTE